MFASQTSAFALNRAAHAYVAQMETSQNATLNHLIEDCIDTRHAYRAAAAVPGRHRGELMALSRRSSSFAEKLSSLVRRSGAAPSRRGSASSFVRRSLFDFRVRLMGQSHLGDALQACAAQTERTAHAYDRALRGSSKWSNEVEGILREHLAELLTSRERVVTLRGHL
jgi:uncharacterized protein (TIGR02284 family)